jgi:hypothetical protein
MIKGDKKTLVKTNKNSNAYFFVSFRGNRSVGFLVSS